MTTLITGVGAVGAHVAQRLQEQDEQLVLYDLAPRTDFLATLIDLDRATVIQGDVNDREALTRAVRENKVDRIVHLAGLLTRQLNTNPYGGVQLNVLGTTAVLEVARTTEVRRVVFASTRGVNQLAAPSTTGEPLVEDFVMHVLSNRPKTMYELTKLAGEWLGLLYHDMYGVDFAAIRLGGGFGPTPGAPAGLTGGVLRPLVFGAALGEQVAITDSSQTFGGLHEFVYFKDDAEAIALACFAEDLTTRVYNVRMERRYSYAEVVDIVRAVVPGASIDVEKVSAQAMSPGYATRDDEADLTAARTELGWEPKYDLASGIADWVEWIRATDGRF